MKEFRRQERLMGSDFEFIVVDRAENGLLDDCVKEVRRLENLLTEFSSTSQTGLINLGAGQAPVAVDHEVYQLIKRCKDLSHLTQGAFDITSGVLKRLYNFKGGDFTWPNESVRYEKLKSTGADKIILTDPDTVYLSRRGMHIAFGAIGKGYAADCVKKMLLKRNVNSGVINAGGDLTAWGSRADGSSWKVGIADPKDPSKKIAWLPVKECSIATSGDYEQFTIRNGVRYSHTIDPKTGLPTTGIKSVTVVSASAELSDALATAVFVMGVDTGLHFINQLPGIHTLIVDDQNRIFTSRHLTIQSHENIAA